MLEDSSIWGSSEGLPKNPPDKPNPRGGRCHSTVIRLQGTSLMVSESTYQLPEAPDALTLSSAKGSTCPWTVGSSLPGKRLLQASGRETDRGE